MYSDFFMPLEYRWLEPKYLSRRATYLQFHDHTVHSIFCFILLSASVLISVLSKLRSFDLFSREFNGWLKQDNQDRATARTVINGLLLKVFVPGERLITLWIRLLSQRLWLWLSKKKPLLWCRMPRIIAHQNNIRHPKCSSAVFRDLKQCPNIGTNKAHAFKRFLLLADPSGIWS